MLSLYSRSLPHLGDLLESFLRRQRGMAKAHLVVTLDTSLLVVGLELGELDLHVRVAEVSRVEEGGCFVVDAQEEGLERFSGSTRRPFPNPLTLRIHQASKAGRYSLGARLRSLLLASYRSNSHKQMRRGRRGRWITIVVRITRQRSVSKNQHQHASKTPPEHILRTSSYCQQCSNSVQEDTPMPPPKHVNKRLTGHCVTCGCVKAVRVQSKIWMHGLEGSKERCYLEGVVDEREGGYCC